VIIPILDNFEGDVINFYCKLPIFEKNNTMTTLIIDNSSKEAKKMLEFLKTQTYVKVVEKRPNRETQRAIRIALDGNVTKTDSVADLMQKLNQ